MPDPLLIIASILFLVGLVGLLARRSMLICLLSFNLSMAGAVVAICYFAWRRGETADAGVGVIFMMLGVIQTVVGVASALAVYRRRGTINLEELRELRG